MVMTRKEIIYNPRKVLDIAQREPYISPSDLKEMGLGFHSAYEVLRHMESKRYLEECAAYKRVLPPGLKVENGELKRLREGRYEIVFKLVKKLKGKSRKGKSELGPLRTFEIIS